MEMEMMKQFSHFSHRHPLERLEMHENDQIICSGCELDLTGSAYICSKPNCSFVLHDLCVELSRQIRHKSHPKHPLILLSSPPYDDGEFTCDACGNSGHGFTYHCSTCKFDLHVECASLPEIESRYDHEHPLALLHSFPHREAAMEASNLCYACQAPLVKNCWLYYCLACNCGTHLECVSDEECQLEIKESAKIAVLEVDYS